MVLDSAVYTRDLSIGYVRAEVVSTEQREEAATLGDCDSLPWG